MNSAHALIVPSLTAEAVEEEDDDTDGEAEAEAEAETAAADSEDDDWRATISAVSHTLTAASSPPDMMK